MVGCCVLRKADCMEESIICKHFRDLCEAQDQDQAQDQGYQPTLQGLLGSVQLLLLLGQLHAELRGREHVGRAAPLALLQVLAQHVLHLPQQVHLLLELGHLLSQQDCKTSREGKKSLRLLVMLSAVSLI